MGLPGDLLLQQRTFEIETNIAYTVRLEIRYYQSRVRLAGLVAVTMEEMSKSFGPLDVSIPCWDCSGGRCNPLRVQEISSPRTREAKWHRLFDTGNHLSSIIRQGSLQDRIADDTCRPYGQMQCCPHSRLMIQR